MTYTIFYILLLYHFSKGYIRVTCFNLICVLVNLAKLACYLVIKWAISFSDVQPIHNSRKAAPWWRALDLVVLYQTVETMCTIPTAITQQREVTSVCSNLIESTEVTFWYGLNFYKLVIQYFLEKRISF